MIQGVKGMRDILPPASGVWNFVEAAARRVATQTRDALEEAKG